MRTPRRTPPRPAPQDVTGIVACLNCFTDFTAAPHGGPLVRPWRRRSLQRQWQQALYAVRRISALGVHT